QRQPHQRRHRPVSTQHGIGQLEQRIRPPRQTPVELPAKPGQIPERVNALAIMHTTHRGPCC
ncbi:MAG: hypothetical protein GEU97_21525, partial [Actinophytocola sp.]|nr:hypothetical protein [Actinophytocola sp.]